MKIHLNIIRKLVVTETFQELPLRKQAERLVFEKSGIKRNGLLQWLLYILLLTAVSVTISVFSMFFGISTFVLMLSAGIFFSRGIKIQKISIEQGREIRVFSKIGKYESYQIDEITALNCFLHEIKPGIEVSQNVLVGIETKDERSISLLSFPQNIKGATDFLVFCRTIGISKNEFLYNWNEIFPKITFKQVLKKLFTELQKPKTYYTPRNLEDEISQALTEDKTGFEQRGCEQDFTDQALYNEIETAQQQVNDPAKRKYFLSTTKSQKLINSKFIQNTDNIKQKKDSKQATGFKIEDFWKILKSHKKEGFIGGIINRPIAVLMVVLGILVFGWVSYDRLALMLMPPISYPTLTVQTKYPAASPEIVEEEISRRLEEDLGSVENLINKSSISRPEKSEVYLEFKWGTNISQAATEVRQKFGRINLPRDAEAPLILRYDPTIEPIMRFVIKSEVSEDTKKDKNYWKNILLELRYFAEFEIKPELEKIEGVAAVKIEGGFTPRVHITINESSLEAYNLTLDEVNNILNTQNTEQAAGTIQEGNRQYLVRAINKFRSIDDIENLELVPGVALKNIGSVVVDEIDPELYTRFAGQPAIEIGIQKEADANIVDVSHLVWQRLFGEKYLTVRENKGVYDIKDLAAEKVSIDDLIIAERMKADEEAKKAAEEAKKDPKKDSKNTNNRSRRRGRRGMGGGFNTGGIVETEQPLVFSFPSTTKIALISDQAFFIEDAIDEVKVAAILGGILAIIILFAFLRDITKTIIIAVAIPISVVATFAPMKIFGVSLNIMSLGGLALGIGMLVDNAIVVLESIARCREEGDNKDKSSKRGVSEVAGAITASTLTTIAVFGPVIFVEGIAGQIFKHQAMTVVFALLISLLVALYVIPTLSARGIEGRAIFRDILSIFKLRVLKNWKKFFPGFKTGKTGVNIFKGIIIDLFMLIFLPLKLIELIVVSIFELTTRYFILLPIFLTFFIIVKLVKFIRLIMRVLFYVPLMLFDLAFKILSGVYPIALKWVLSHKVWVLLIAVTAMIFTGMYGTFFLPGNLRLFVEKLDRQLNISPIEEELIPQLGQNEFSADFEFRQGVNLDYTNSQMKFFEDALNDLYSKPSREKSMIERYFLTVGKADRGKGEIEAGENLARIVIVVKAKADSKVKKIIEEKLTQTAKLNFLPKPDFKTPVLFTFKTPIEIEVKGKDLAKLKNTALGINQELTDLTTDDGRLILSEVKTTIKRGNPEVVVRFDRKVLQKFNLTPSQAVEIFKKKIQGSIPTQYTYGDRRIDVVLEINREKDFNLGDMLRIKLLPNLSLKDSLDAVDGFTHREGPSEIRRRGNQRVVIVSASPAGSVTLSEAKRNIVEVLNQIQTPTGVMIKISGQTEEMERSFDSLIFAFLLAIFLVYIVMASQFESLVQPFIIMFTIPLSLVGVVLGLLIFNLSISVVVLIGIIMLAGIVVNNAIVLIDRINYERKKGVELREAIIIGAKIRLRPVLITSLTTILGLVPLAGWISIGITKEGVEMRAPLAITVIFGLAVATFLTLLVIPVVYEFIENLRPSRNTR